MRFRAEAPPAAEAEGDAHQKSLRVAPSPNGMGEGTGPFQGGRSASSALRGGGIVTAPWPAASAGSARATAARRCIGASIGPPPLVTGAMRRRIHTASSGRQPECSVRSRAPAPAPAHA